MKDNTKESNDSKNDYIDESINKNKSQISPNKNNYQKLSTETQAIPKKSKCQKCLSKKKFIIISIIIIITIISILCFFAILIFTPRPKVAAYHSTSMQIDNMPFTVNELVNYNMGFSTGGAKDTNNFRENIKNGYFPISTDITYNGLFYDYYFDTGEKTESKYLFSPSYSLAISKDPISLKNEYYMTVGLNSNIKQSDFKRKKLNLVVVLDISGSMSSPFYSYYYDCFSKDKKDRV